MVEGMDELAPSTARRSEGRGGLVLGPRFDQAFLLASELHRHQLRKGTGSPYMSHLLAVCSIVLENGGDEDEAMAALLHDAAEDQGGQATLELIRARFGEGVASIVEGCSDSFERSKPPALERKRAFLARLDAEGVARSVLLVVAADKVHNLRSTLADYHAVGDALWDRFRLSPAEQLWYYHSMADVLSRRLGGPVVTALAGLVAELAVVAGPQDAKAEVVKAVAQEVR